MQRENSVLASLILAACMMMPGITFAQSGEISGTVTDSLSGEPVPGVNVVISGTSQGAATSAEGTYTISGVEVGTYDLQASFVGYQTKLIEDVEVEAGETTEVDIALVESAVQLQEVVAVAYGTQERQAVTGSVANIDTENIQAMPINSVDEALQGQIAGVSVQSASGIPGGGPAIQVRGTGNVGAGGQPLYVIDGYALPQPGQGSVTRRNPLAEIPPSDIESITVLKDASATAIYGSRASNGVVVVQTKSGQAGSFDFNVSASTGWNTPWDRDVPKPANAQQFATFQNFIWSDRVAQGAADEVPAEYRNPDQYGEGTNWWDAIMRTGRRHNVNVSARGGTSDIRSYFSVGLTQDEGLLRAHDFSRISARANVDATIGERMDVGLRINPTFSERNLNWGGEGRGGPGGAPWMLCPLEPVRNEDGSLYTQPGRACTGVWSHPNPVHWLEAEVNEEQTLRTVGSAFVDYTLAEGLSVREQFNVDYRNSTTDFFVPSTIGGINSPPPSTPTGGLSTGGYLNWLTETTVNYQAELGPGEIDALAGFTAQQQTEGGAGFSGIFPGDAIRTLNVASQIDGSSSEAEWSLLSGLGRINYTLMDRYVFTGTFRSDGSSRFGEQNRWGNFPSGAVAWNLHNESFMQDASEIQQLRMRASYGVTGNNQIGNYAHLGVVNSSDYVLGGSAAAGRVLSTMGNPRLSWEKTEEFNFGIDAVLYDRLDLAVDLYQRNTTQLLINRELPLVAGFGSVTENTGNLRNRGLEVSMTSTNVQREDFRWNTDVTFALNRNEIVSLPGGNDIRYTNWPVEYLHREGQPMASYVGFAFDGLFTSEDMIDNVTSFPGSVPGTMIWRDVNNDGTMTEDVMAPNGDYVILGDAYPDFTFSFQNTLQIGNFDIRALLNGEFGSTNIRSEWITTYRNIDGLFNVDAEYVENFWRSRSNPGDGLTPTPIGGATPRQQYRDTQSSVWLWDASHIWLRDLTVRYNLGGALQGASIYATGSNLFVLSPYPSNPDATDLDDASNSPGRDDGNYPVPRRFTVGVDLSF